ncbi:SRPBCC domain-containing protein [Amycolatopsis sp. NPDC102389]|uniref:SRPBCC domain-containing protein n=1 Tax=Amycolatopsis sp. NPDC102389 TaxID=3363941 RepID=UPI00380FDB57
MISPAHLRVGGRWRYAIAAGDGVEHAFSGEFREVEAPHRVVYTECYEPVAGSEHLVTVTFEERDGRTVLRDHCSYSSKEARDAHVNSGMESGMKATMDALAAELSAMRR